MAVAAVLYMHGKTPTIRRIDPDAHKSEWVFPLGEEDDREYFEDLMSQVEKGDYQVEPIRFLRDVGQIRRQMYDFLGIGKNSRHSVTV
jgi:hypothetical protein